MDCKTAKKKLKVSKEKQKEATARADAAVLARDELAAAKKALDADHAALQKTAKSLETDRDKQRTFVLFLMLLSLYLLS